MIYIGIDPGTHTGVAVWDSKAQVFIELATIPIHQALLKVKNYFIKGRLHFNESKNSAPFPSMVVVF